jgi:hypothetical protein
VSGDGRSDFPAPARPADAGPPGTGVGSHALGIVWNRVRLAESDQVTIMIFNEENKLKCCAVRFHCTTDEPGVI